MNYSRLSVFTIAFLWAGAMCAQIWTQDFETNQLGVQYFSGSVFTNNTNAYYNRTNGSDISSTYASYSQKQGQYIWAGENLNDTSVGGDGLSIKTISFPAISISGITNIEFRGLFGSGNPGNGWDFSDELYVQYQVDLGIWITCMRFATPAMNSNSGLFRDLDLNGIGEGLALTPVLNQFTVSIPVSGATIQFRIISTANGVGEEFAFDYLRVYNLAAAISGCTNPSASNFLVSATTDNGTCVVPGCTDASALNYSAGANQNNGSCIYSVPQIVINEIHYNASQYAGFADNNYEFIELYNRSGAFVDLSGWRISDAVDYTFPFGSGMSAGEWILVARNALTYAGSGYQVFQFTGDMANSSSTLLLFDGNGILADHVTYSNTPSWPLAADGDGPSLELINPSLDNALPGYWCAESPVNGTPGALNSCYSLIQGCTDLTASNYSATAQFNDGSCLYPGCTYASALNYTSVANLDDGSCLFSSINNCPADLNGDLIVNVSDLLLFMSGFGIVCP